MFKIGDVVKVVDEYVSHPYNLQDGSVYVVNDVLQLSGNVNVGVDGQYWNASRFVLLTESGQSADKDYAAAFNMWMDEYINSPQEFEDSYSTALNHVSEKLLGEEPSYGAVAAEQFKQYLSKVEQLALENQNV